MRKGVLVMELANILQKYLPSDVEINTPGSVIAQTVDLDNDGERELIVVYRQQGTPCLLVLKKYNDGWYELGRVRGTGYGVNYLTFTDVTGDGKKEILIGWQVGAAWSELDIYSIKDGKLEKIASEVYSKIEIILPESGSPYRSVYIALWRHVTGEAYAIEVYGWKWNTLVPARNVYPFYFKKVVLYYIKKVMEMPGAAFYWYYLADAQIKAELPGAALYSIDRGMSLHLEYPSKADFLALRKIALEQIRFKVQR